MQELVADNLSEIIAGSENVIVQYGAAWCGSCRIIKPQFQSLAAQERGVTFLYVDAEKYPESRQLANVQNLPTFAGFKNGVLVKQGFGTKIETVKEILNEIARN